MRAEGKDGGRQDRDLCGQKGRDVAGRTHCTLSSVSCLLATSTTRRAAVSVREL